MSYNLADSRPMRLLLIRASSRAIAGGEGFREYFLPAVAHFLGCAQRQADRLGQAVRRRTEVITRRIPLTPVASRAQHLQVPLVIHRNPRPIGQGDAAVTVAGSGNDVIDVQRPEFG